MVIKTSSKRSNRGKRKINILLSDINYATTYIGLDLPLTLCCDKCRLIKEAKRRFLKKSSHEIKRHHDASDCRRCQQPWKSINGEQCRTIATNHKFVRVRNYLKIDCDVEIKTCYIYDNSTKTQMIKQLINFKL